MFKSPAQGPTPCGSPTILPQTRKARLHFTEPYRRAGRNWFVTFWRREPIQSSSMRTVKSRSICSTLLALVVQLARVAGEAELQRLVLPRLTTRGAVPVQLLPLELVVVALGVEVPTRQLQPRFARCCKMQRRRSSLRGARISLRNRQPSSGQFLLISCGD